MGERGGWGESVIKWGTRVMLARQGWSTKGYACLCKEHQFRRAPVVVIGFL